MKLTLPIVWNIFRIGHYNLGGDMLTLIGICQILTPIQPEFNSTILITSMHASAKVQLVFAVDPYVRVKEAMLSIQCPVSAAPLKHCSVSSPAHTIPYMEVAPES